MYEHATIGQHKYSVTADVAPLRRQAVFPGG